MAPFNKKTAGRLNKYFKVNVCSESGVKPAVNVLKFKFLLILGLNLDHFSFNFSVMAVLLFFCSFLLSAYCTIVIGYAAILRQIAKE